MMTADMVEMSMARDRDRVREPGEPANETHRSQPGVEQEASVATPDVPDIAAVERLDVRLEYVRHAVREGCAAVPLGEALHTGGTRPVYGLILDVPLPLLCDVNLPQPKLD